MRSRSHAKRGNEEGRGKACFRLPGLDSHKHRAYYRRQSAYNLAGGKGVTRKPASVTDAELAVLKVLWGAGQ